MHNTTIEVFKIAQTRVNWREVVKWLTFVGVKDAAAVVRQIQTLSSEKFLGYSSEQPADPIGRIVATDASALVALCGKRCYQSFDTESGLNPNVTKIRTDHLEYITNVLASGHGSVLEHATWSFAIENVSRVFTGEMNRHRAGVAISEGSMRYIRFDDIGFTVPSSLELTGEEECAFEHACTLTNNPIERRDLNMVHYLMDAGSPSEFINGTTTTEQDLVFSACRKLLSLDAFNRSFKDMEKLNLDLCNIWKIDDMKDFTKKKQLTSMFRRIIGMGVSTGGIWTMNARALRHIIAMRASKHAEEEIHHVFDKIADIMVNDEPALFGDFTKDADGFWAPKFPKV